MNDPHVEALIYVVEHVETVKYDSATSIEFDRPAFHGKVEDEWSGGPKGYPHNSDLPAGTGGFRSC